MDPLKVYITLEVFVHFSGKSDQSMHWIFQRNLKSAKVRVYLEQELLVQIPCSALRKDGGKINGLNKLLVQGRKLNKGFCFLGSAPSAPPWCALGGGSGGGGGEKGTPQ